MIVMFSQVYDPDPTATAQTMAQIANGLVKQKNRKVMVLCGTEAPSSREMTEEICPEVVRVYCLHLPKDYVPFRALNILSFCFSVLIAGLVKIPRRSVIFSVTNPPFLPWIAKILAWLKGGKCVELSHDVYPDIAVIAGMISRSSFLFWTWNLLNNFFLQQMDVIIAIGRDMKEILDKKVGKSGCDKVTVITNWAGSKDVKTLKKKPSPLIQEWGLKDKFIVQCAGNHGRTHCIETLAKAAAILEKSNPEIYILVIGNGVKVPWLKNWIAKYRPANLAWKPFVPREKLNELLATSDNIAIFGYISGMKGLSAPTRLYNYMAVGSPVIGVCEEGSEFARVLEEEGMGWVTPPGDATMLAEKIRFVHQNQELRLAAGQKAFEAMRHYEFDAKLESIDQLLYNLSR